MTISNTDDHLRNHGFILNDKGWRLSPAYDLNPSIDKAGLALNIDMDDNRLDYDLAKSVGVFFRIGNMEMDKIIEDVKDAVGKWRQVAAEIGISRAEQELMAGAFTLATR
jgi:serine/threonine-protein kinase HipA